MEPMSWTEWLRKLEQPIPRSLINEEVEPEGETAEQRAWRKWGMTEGASVPRSAEQGKDERC